jgi:hypothetical protein
MYKNLNAGAYCIFSANGMASNFQSYSFLLLIPAVVVLSAVSVRDIVHILLNILKLTILIVKLAQSV